jgi:hypothetical protein
MNRIALSCRPTQALESIIQKAHDAGIRAFDTPFISRVPHKLKQITVGANDRSKVLLRTTESNKDVLEFQVRTFANVAGESADIYVLALDPEYDPEASFEIFCRAALHGDD